jgi:hypothetical protein
MPETTPIAGVHQQRTRRGSQSDDAAAIQVVGAFAEAAESHEPACLSPNNSTTHPKIFSTINTITAVMDVTNDSVAYVRPAPADRETGIKLSHSRQS